MLVGGNSSGVRVTEMSTFYRALFYSGHLILIWAQLSHRISRHIMKGNEAAGVNFFIPFKQSSLSFVGVNLLTVNSSVP